MKVAIAWATAEVQDLVEVEVPIGTSVADAVARSGLIDTYGLDRAVIGFAIFGRRVAPDAPIADGDRIDLTRPLAAEPKAARARRVGLRPRDGPSDPPKRRRGA